MTPPVDLRLMSWRRKLIAAIDERLVAMVRRPALYGPDIAVELQVVQLLAVRAAALRDEPGPLGTFRPGDALVAFNRRHFPDAPPVTLSDLLAARGESHRLGELLGDFCREVIHMLDSEAASRSDPVPLHDLMLRAHGRFRSEEGPCT